MKRKALWLRREKLESSVGVERVGWKELGFLCPAILGQGVPQSLISHNYHPHFGMWWHTWPGEPDQLCAYSNEGCLPKMRNIWPRLSRNLALAWWPLDSGSLVTGRGCGSQALL